MMLWWYMTIWYDTIYDMIYDDIWFTPKTKSPALMTHLPTQWCRNKIQISYLISTLGPSQYSIKPIYPIHFVQCLGQKYTRYFGWKGTKRPSGRKNEATHSTAEWERLRREQGETCQTQIVGRRIHINNVNRENDHLKTQFQVQINDTTGARERPPTECLCLHNRCLFSDPHKTHKYTVCAGRGDF